MAHVIRPPCDERSARRTRTHPAPRTPWILATILVSSMAFIDETAVTVALLAVAGVAVTVSVVAHCATATPLSSL
jgi:hypothetical protein